MNVAAAIDRVDVTVEVRASDLADGRTLDDVWASLVDLGHNPDVMVRHPDRIVVHTTKEASDG